jgi:hypothetical protein
MSDYGSDGNDVGIVKALWGWYSIGDVVCYKAQRMVPIYSWAVMTNMFDVQVALTH